MTTQLTKKRIAGMMKENTGIHMLDSGMSNGRAWQRNQGRDFEKELPVTLKIHRWGDDSTQYDIDVTINLYHWLTDLLAVTAESGRIEKKFHKFTAGSEKSYFADVDSFLDHEGIKAQVINTYNNSDTDLLSQVIQYWQFEHTDGNQYCFLMVHGGADVRGGYTAPRVFHIPGFDSDYALYRTNEAGVYCTECEDGHWGFGYDGYTLTHEDSNEKFNYPVILESELQNIEDKIKANSLQVIVPPSQISYDTDYNKILAQGVPLVINPDMADYSRGYVVLMDDESILCPLCGKGKLQAGANWTY